MVSPWSNTKNDIVKHTIRLWTYLQALAGRLELIEPLLGGPVDLDKADAFDGDDVESPPSEFSRCVVKWVLSRGFRYIESNVDGLRTYEFKARVVV
jgi:hypothetical protein